MHLKNIQVVGFKSFADRIKLDFEPGLACVVGPNGCGKSNIIDAFRWCLGEMSAKSLRSNLMMDVIFNGSGSRPAQNMAEVTLTFDNTDKRLPIDFSEVSISRRLFRSGESEYYINKTQCRLRDIRELFLDTGMGEDGYSSMEQGKVEWVLQAKPEQRRELFEEAAGVSKYRARREEAVRKLDRVEIDLSRINDIVSVTKDQIRKLENAVNRAKTYERIRGELKVMEIGDWLSQLSSVDEDLKKNEIELGEKTSEAERLNTLTHQMDADLAELRRKMAETEEQLLEANGVLSAIDADIKIGEERVTQSKQRQQELSQQIEKLKETKHREEGRLTELQNQSEQQNSALLQFQEDGKSIEETYKKSEEACKLALLNLETKQNDIKQAREMILAQAQERARLQQQISELTSDVSRAKSQIESNQKELGKAQQEKEKVAQSIRDMEAQKEERKNQLSEKSATHEKIASELSELKNKEQSIQENIFNDAEEIAKLKGQIHSIEEQQNQDPYLYGTRAILGANLAGIHGPIGRVFQCDDTDRDIISASIGEHLGDLVAESAEDAARAIDFLESQGKGRGRIWVLENLPSQSEMSDLADQPGREKLINRIRCEDKFKPLLAYLCSGLWVQGTTIFGKAVINGGVDPSKWQTHVTMRLPELQATLESKEGHYRELESNLNQVTQEKSEKTLNKDALVKDLEEARVRFEFAQEETSKLQQKMDLIEEEITVIGQEKNQIEEEKTKHEASLEQTQNQLNDLHEKEKNDNAALDIAQQELSELQLAHSSANADLSTKQEQYNSYQEKLNWHQSIVDHSQKEINAVKSSIEHHQQTAEQLTKEIEVSEKTQVDAQKLIEESLDKRKVAAESVASIQAVRAQDSEKITQSEKEVGVLRDQLTVAQDAVHAKQLEKTNLSNKQETVSQKLQDQYEISLDEAKKQFEILKAEPEKLEKLKKRVSNMGPINLAAPQEHAELMEKSTFLTSQQEDLLKAKEDLRQVISKINATTKEHFRETFEKVRDNFRTLYAQLFRGGEADLRLTDENDILSSGIDIFCQPPGKKLLHISLLSGGEKALTASALLFAFFQVRPSPVALLDEVDAPLDEANVLRFVEMVKVFSEKTQFLIISHNKRTMEAANTLYGVTMEEFGVSKILSARLQKEAKPDESNVEAEPATA